MPTQERLERGMFERVTVEDADGEEVDVYNWVNVEQRTIIRGHNPTVEQFGADIGAGDSPEPPEAVTPEVAEELHWEHSIDVVDHDIRVIDPTAEEVDVL
jgi:hypothetical protein